MQIDPTLPVHDPDRVPDVRPCGRGAARGRGRVPVEARHAPRRWCSGPPSWRSGRDAQPGGVPAAGAGRRGAPRRRRDRDRCDPRRPRRGRRRADHPDPVRRRGRRQHVQARHSEAARCGGGRGRAADPPGLRRHPPGARGRPDHGGRGGRARTWSRTGSTPTGSTTGTRTTARCTTPCRSAPARSPDLWCFQSPSSTVRLRAQPVRRRRRVRGHQAARCSPRSRPSPTVTTCSPRSSARPRATGPGSARPGRWSRWRRSG